MAVAGLFALPAAAQGSMYWGATISGEPYGQTGAAPHNETAWNLFEKHAGRKAGIVNMGQGWGQFDTDELEATHARGAIPMVTMGLGSGVTLEQIADGGQDTVIRAWARAAKAWGYPFYFAPWWEMNGEWYPWGRDPEYVAAWRHFHDLVVAEGATNVTWTWVSNSLWFDPLSDPAPWYPGDAYVDWVGIDSYNWGRNPAQPDRWLNPDQTITPTLERVREISPNKPVVIVENASSEYGGNKADWIREMLGTYLPNHPEIDAYMWFNWNFEKDNGLRADWPIESSATAQQAFRAGIQSGLFRAVPSLPKLTKVPPPSPASGGTSPAPADLSPPGAEAASPQVAVAPDGTATVVWSGADGATRSVFARRISPQGVPQAVERLSVPGANALVPQLAVAPDGTVTVVWIRWKEEMVDEGTPDEHLARNFVVQARRIEPDGGLGPVLELSAVRQDALDPDLAVAPDGTATVVWKRFDGTRFLVKERRIEADGSLDPTPSFTLSPTSGRDSVEPRVAVAADGNATVAWSRFDGSNSVIQARLIETGGDPATTTHDLSVAGQNAIEPDLAIGADGSAEVVWVRSNGANTIVQHRRVDADGTPDAATHDLSATGRSAAEPQIGSAPGGSVATVVWDRFDGTNFIVQSRRLGAGGVPEAITRSLSSTGRDAAEPQLAVSPDGTATVVWSRFDGTNWVVQRVGLKADGSPVPGVNLSAAGRSAGSPQVALTGGQAPVSVWRRFDGAFDIVQGNPLTAPNPVAELSPATHDFGSVEVGAGAAGVQEFAITNSGNSPLLISSISASGPDADHFPLADTGACTDAPIPIGGSCEFTAAFDPSAAGELEATVEVTSNAASSPDAVALSGTAVAAPMPPTPTAKSATPVLKVVENSFQLGKPVLNRRRGTAQLPVTVPGPGTVTLLGGRRHLLRFSEAGSAKLPVRAAKAKMRKLIDTGKARLRVTVTFAPDGGAPSTQTKTVVLKKSAR
ncbi:MAG TPA: choice-of-anchor D domain-containing protein [Solirubrobacterales bacterium]